MCLSVNHDDKASYAHAFLYNDFCISDVSQSVVDWLFMASDHCQLNDHKNNDHNDVISHESVTLVGQISFIHIRIYTATTISH